MYQIITRESHDAGLPIGILYCNGRGMMEDRVQRAAHRQHLRAARLSPHARPAAAIETYERWLRHVRSNFCVFHIAQDGDTVTFATGRYLDRIVRDGDALRFSSRRVVLDSRRRGYSAGIAAVAPV